MGNDVSTRSINDAFGLDRVAKLSQFGLFASSPQSVVVSSAPAPGIIGR